MKIAIVGAGMSGLSCADALAKQGHEVSLFDKGRGPGGRMSTRRLVTPMGDVRVDHGAQYFTVRDNGFSALVADWAERGLALPWSLAGRDAWVAVPGMSAVIKDMASRHNVSFEHLVHGLTYGEAGWTIVAELGEFGPYDAVMLAIPAEQAAPILALHDFSMASSALQAKSLPCWTAMFVFDEPLAVADDVIRDMGDIAWAARNSAKPGRTGPEAWVVQATAYWSIENLERTTEMVLPPLQKALERAIGEALPAPIAKAAHRWRFALSAGVGAGSFWNPKIKLGVCGDWLLGPRVECAWLSGKHLGQSVVGEMELVG